MTSSAQAAPSPLASVAVRRAGRYVLFEEFARGEMASVHFARPLGPARVLDGGAARVVVEYVHGVTAAELFVEARLRGERAPVGIVADALEGLHATHEARDAHGKALGIIQRDVSPPNVHVGGDGHARRVDFGIAKVLDRTQVTAPGVVKGKIASMAREQLGGAPVTRLADVYGAGVVRWELLVGRRLFDEKEPTLLANQCIPADVSLGIGVVAAAISTWLFLYPHIATGEPKTRVSFTPNRGGASLSVVETF